MHFAIKIILSFSFLTLLTSPILYKAAFQNFEMQQNVENSRKKFDQINHERVSTHGKGPIVKREDAPPFTKPLFQKFVTQQKVGNSREEFASGLLDDQINHEGVSTHGEGPNIEKDEDAPPSLTGYF